MIKTDLIAPGVLKIIAPEKLDADDFSGLAPQIKAIMKQQGQIRLLIDASHLDGWENIAALEKHAAFVKAHQQKVDRIAVIARHDWQHWLVGAVRVFVHPEVKTFDKGDESEALRWLEDRSSAGAAHDAASKKTDADSGLLWEIDQHQGARVA
jgi:hypothetical protein